MAQLAINGSTPVRTAPFPIWPWNLEESAHAVDETVLSGRWGSINGEKVRKFENCFASFQQTNYGIAVCNGTTALSLALQASGVGPGDEVIVPAYTFIASAGAIMMSNAVPIFVDIAPQTYNIDPLLVEQAISPRTKAILVVHFGGLPADMDLLKKIARRHNLVLIEDAAQAHGAKIGDMSVGGLGTISGFSFQASKNLTSGEGGIVLTNDGDMAELVRSLSDCGHPLKGPRYTHYYIAGNHRMTELQGSLLLSQIKNLELQTQLRHENGEYLTEQLQKIPGIIPLSKPPEVTRHSRHLYIFRYLKNAFHGIPKNYFIDALRAEGIPASPGYSRPLYKQPVFIEKNFGIYQNSALSSVEFDKINLPVTEMACYSEGIWLTQNVLLGDRADMNDIVNAIEKIAENRDELYEAYK